MVSRDSYQQNDRAITGLGKVSVTLFGLVNITLAGVCRCRDYIQSESGVTGHRGRYYYDSRHLDTNEGEMVKGFLPADHLPIIYTWIPDQLHTACIRYSSMVSYLNTC